VPISTDPGQIQSAVDISGVDLAQTLDSDRGRGRPVRRISGDPFSHISLSNLIPGQGYARTGAAAGGTVLSAFAKSLRLGTKGNSV